MAAGQQGCPGAFPLGLAGRDRAYAGAIVGSDLPRIGRVVHRVVEAKHVTDAVLGRMEHLHRVVYRMLDDMDDYRVTRGGWGASAGGGRDGREHQRGQGRCGGYELLVSGHRCLPVKIGPVTGPGTIISQPARPNVAFIPAEPAV